AARRARGEPGLPLAGRAHGAAAAPVRGHPRQQHQPDPARGQRPAARAVGGGRRGRRRRHGDLAVTAPAPPLAADAFVARLREEGVRRYHDQHPFHQLMHDGKLTRAQLQAWTLNRYYYQTRIPIKDAVILSRSEDPAFRRAWIHRIHDHDGDAPGTGGLALWLKLAEAVGLDPDEVASCRRVLPGVRFACDSYVTLCRESPLVVAVASSLTEMFAPD